jgi:hypothetical protein
MESKELRRRAAKCEQNDREVDKTPRHALSDDGAALNIAHNNSRRSRINSREWHLYYHLMP